MAKTLASATTIGTQSSSSQEKFEVVNPATGLPFATAPSHGAAELDQAVETASKALGAWKSSEIARRNALLDCAKEIERAAEELARLITQEQGKPLSQARGEVAHAVKQFRECAKLPIPRTILSQEGPTRSVLVQRPIGVVGLVTPWNFPIGTAAVKIAPALLAGNTVILKPSPHAPLSPLLLGRLLEKRLATGVLNVLSGSDELGALLAQHPAVDKISLTGSIASGKSVLRDAAEHVKSVTLELGGNDPAIILPDADTGQIASPILDSAWRNAGQVCSAIKRVYVHESLYPKMVSQFRSHLPEYQIGDGMDPTSRMGPLTTLKQLRRVSEFSDRVSKAGGRLHSTFAKVKGDGHFFAPAIVTGIDAEHPLVQDEQFGPILPVVPYNTIEEAIAMANGTHFGLSASVWTANPTVGYEVASQMECGRVGINGHRRGEVVAPFGGFKQSGIGRELGPWGLLEMCQPQVINIFA